MTDPSIFEFEINLQPYGGKEIFKDSNDLQKWLNKEKDFWKWPENLRNLDHDAFQAANQIANKFNNFEGLKNNLLATKDNAANFKNLKNELIREMEENYRSGQLVPSSSPYGKFLKDLIASDPVLAAHTFRFTAKGYDFNATNRNHFKGAFTALVAHFDLSRTSKSEEDAFSSLRDSFQEVINESKKIFDKTDEEQQKLIQAHKKQTEKQDAEFKSFIDEAVKSKDKLYTEIQKKLDDIEKTYNEKLALHSAIQYWDDKSKTHRISTIWLIVAVLIAFVLVGIGLNSSIKNVIGENTKLMDVQIWEFGLLALIATIGVWVIRVLVRVLLSNIHLWSDAKERRTMLLTYLALLRKGELPEGDTLNLILQALFRPSSIGIIKDDAVPPFLAEWLKRTTGD